MSILTPWQFDQLFPLACAWVEEQERAILKSGVALTAEQIADARRIGVKQPERVRLLGVPEIALPHHPELASVAQEMKLITPFTVGLTLRYGIFVQASCWGQRRLIIHELAHTMQYERLGSIEAFLRQYLHDVLTIGYPESPLEQEARGFEVEMLIAPDEEE